MKIQIKLVFSNKNKHNTLTIRIIMKKNSIIKEEEVVEIYKDMEKKEKNSQIVMMNNIKVDKKIIIDNYEFNYYSYFQYIILK